MIRKALRFALVALSVGCGGSEPPVLGLAGNYTGATFRKNGALVTRLRRPF